MTIEVVVHWSGRNRLPEDFDVYSEDRVQNNESGLNIYDVGTQETGAFYPWHRIHKIEIREAAKPVDMGIDYE